MSGGDRGGDPSHPSDVRNASGEAAGGGAAGDGESTRERILDVAERLFAQKGFAGTVVRDIAREAGLTAPSLYNHFAGKQALYEAVLARGVQPLVDLMRGLGEAEEIRSSDVLNAFMDHFANHPDLPRLIQHESLVGGASLSQIARDWIRPIVVEATLAMKRNPDVRWTEEEQPLVIASWIHMILGHFAMAPLVRELFDFDPLEPEQLEREKRFLARYVEHMLSGPRD